MRIAAIVEYDGSRFSGWQLQDGDRTVQGCVEEALSKVANASLRVTVAGRTDAGVHASGQVIHFDSNATRRDYEWLRGANTSRAHSLGCSPAPILISTPAIFRTIW